MPPNLVITYPVFARALVPSLKNLDVFTPRIDTQQLTQDNLDDTKEMVCRGILQRLADLFAHQVYLSLS